MDYSLISQSPEMRALVQERTLERAFHDALYPRALFRGEVEDEFWPGQIGDSMLFSAPGLLKPSGRQLRPDVEPTPLAQTYEQWEATLGWWGATIDIAMVNSMLALANLFLRDGHQLGLQAAQSMNRLVRGAFYNAAESGNTVVDTAVVGGTSIHVKHLNGFTRARNPLVTGASKVRFSEVSPSNPLTVTLFDNGAATANTVVGYVPDYPGDEVGPGTLTLGTALTNVAARAYLLAVDRSFVVRSGGGNSVDSIGPTDLPSFSDVRAIVANMRNNYVPKHADGRFHVHLDPVSEIKLFEDPALERLNTAMPDYYMYRDLAIGEFHECIFYGNEECPQTTTVDGGATDTYSQDDSIATETYSNGNASTGTKLHHILVTGAGQLKEYYNDQSGMISEAGITGKITEFSLNNNGFDINTDRIKLIMRAPLDRMQMKPALSWSFIGAWAARTDAAVGGARTARFKRSAAIIHGE